MLKNADLLFIALVNLQKQGISRRVNWTMVNMDCFAKILAICNLMNSRGIPGNQFRQKFKILYINLLNFVILVKLILY